MPSRAFIRGRGRDSSEVTLNLTPMIDCVFLLLIFFMLTTVFKEPYSLRVILPDSQSAGLLENKQLVASITQDGQMEVNRVPVTLSTLEATLVAAKQEARTVTLTIRADKGTKHGVVLDVIEQAKRNGIEEVLLAAEEKQRQ